MQTFGLQKEVIPDGDYVREQLDRNDQHLFDVAQAMANGVREQLNANATNLAMVDKRLRASVTGHVRRNFYLLKPVAQAMSDTVNTMLDQNQAVINGVAGTADMQDRARLVPPQPAYDGTIPQIVPADEPLPAAAAAAPAMRLYTIFLSPDHAELVAVPGNAAAWERQAWSPPAGWAAVRALLATPQEMEAWVKAARQSIT